MSTVSEADAAISIFRQAGKADVRNQYNLLYIIYFYYIMGTIIFE